MADSILKITDLRVETVTGLCLVDNVSLELKRGEVLGLIGEFGRRQVNNRSFGHGLCPGGLQDHRRQD